ncbi:MAG: hypothetical protein QHH24_01135 [Candidatus Bathyarchaeota archaeon]|nr:hypothetical protein [Candidatus Bathyarchaeota archaeon]
MAKTSILAGLSVLLLGFCIPVLSIYATIQYGFSYIATALICLLALIVAGVLAATGLALSSEEIHFEGAKPAEEEKVNLLRAHQRATLEEMDEMVSILKEIRDILKAAHE